MMLSGLAPAVASAFDVPSTPSSLQAKTIQFVTSGWAVMIGPAAWSRTISSTIVGEGLDSTIFMLVAFWGVVPAEVLPSLILSQAFFKTAYEVIATPVTYLIIGWFKRAEANENQLTR